MTPTHPDSIEADIALQAMILRSHPNAGARRVAFAEIQRLKAMQAEAERMRRCAPTHKTEAMQ